MTTNDIYETKAWLDCQCSEPGCSVRISLDREDLSLTMVSRYDVSYLSLWERIKAAVAIIFGHAVVNYGETIFDEQAINDLSKLIVSRRLLFKLRVARSNRG
jgi:hypothetical protein